MTVYEAQATELGGKQIASESATESEQRAYERRQKRARKLFSVRRKASERLLGVQLGLSMTKVRSKRWMQRHVIISLIVLSVAYYYVAVVVGKFVVGALIALFVGHVATQFLLYIAFLFAVYFGFLYLMEKFYYWLTGRRLNLF